MKIKVNDRDLDFNGSTVEKLIKTLFLEPGRVVVERNGNIVSRDKYGDTYLNEGDILEIVRFVGGG